MTDCTSIEPYLIVRTKATVDKVHEMFSLVGDVLQNVNLDQRQRVTEMLREKKVCWGCLLVVLIS